MERMSPSDRSALAAERGSVNMAIGGVMVLDRGPGVTYDALCARIAERIHLLPRYRQRLEQPALGLTNPVWVDDENFDVEWHVRLSRLPEPGGEAELGAFIGREFSRRMDRTRPLWELHVVEGLPDDRIAVIPKMHHALVDGLAALGIVMILLDPSPEPLPVEPPAEEWSPQPRAMKRYLARLAAQPVVRAQRLFFDGTAKLLDTSARSAALDLRRTTEILAAIASTRSPAPPLPFNRRITANRSYALASAPLAAIKAAGKAAGGTVNDAILAAVSGMLASYLEDAGVVPHQLVRDPVALVPVSLRGEGDAAVGNRISIVFVDLPVGEPDPSRRIALIAERMTRIKGSARVAAGALLVDMSGFAPPLLSSVLARATGGAAAFNLVVSNVPGPQLPLYLNGSRVRAAHSVVPLNPADQGLNVGVFSYDGGVFFGLSADRALDPPLGRALLGLQSALDEVMALAA
jgi:WS/DGAT/MGAT family acyltransferase